MIVNKRRLRQDNKNLQAEHRRQPNHIILNKGYFTTLKKPTIGKLQAAVRVSSRSLLL